MRRTGRDVIYLTGYLNGQSGPAHRLAMIRACGCFLFLLLATQARRMQGGGNFVPGLGCQGLSTCTCTCTVPVLYLYIGRCSADSILERDKVSPFSPVDSLVRYRYSLCSRTLVLLLAYTSRQ